MDMEEIGALVTPSIFNAIWDLALRLLTRIVSPAISTVITAGVTLKSFAIQYVMLHVKKLYRRADVMTAKPLCRYKFAP